MKNKLLLSLWLLGAVLYTGSTVFLANAVLGGVGGHADKAKPTTVAAVDAQCQKASSSDGEDKAAKTASVEQPKPEPAHNPPKSNTGEAANRGSDPQLPVTEAGQQPSESASPSADSQDQQDQNQDASAPDGAPPPDGWQQQASTPDGGADPDQPERDEWAHVVASTADMRSDPSREAALIYALPAGWQVRVISRSNGWVQIQDANSGAAGWVEVSALALVAPGEQQGYDGYPPRDGPGYGPPPRSADEGYPPDPRWHPRYERRGQFADFLRRVLGGY
jgi:Bacterial SH3 domain